MRIVAISGKASSGKDTFAAILAEVAPKLLEAQVHILPFAEDLKKIASQLWGVDPEYLKTYAGKAALRSKLIQLGGVVREIDPNTWVDIVIRKIKAIPDQSALVVIPDLRFLNELYRLIAEFGTDVSMVRMSAPVDARMTRMGVDRAEDYVTLGIQVDISERQFDFIEQPPVRFSETQLPHIQAVKDYAYVISNAASLETLKDKVVEWGSDPSNLPTKEKALAAMKAAYMLAKQIGPEAKLVLAPELLP